MKTAVKKKESRQVCAWELGAGSEMEAQLIRQGRIRRSADGYELFSQEAVNGTGQLARAGDFFKVDGAGYPYPNDRETFLARHDRLDSGRYEQKPIPVGVWRPEYGPDEVVDWLIATGRLVLCREDDLRFFNTGRDGRVFSAAKDAYLTVYGVDRDPDGRITDVNFFFVERGEFLRTYDIVTDR